MQKTSQVESYLQCNPSINFNKSYFSAIIKAINELIIAVNRLDKTTVHHSNVIDELHRYLMECDICTRAQAPSKPSCGTHPPQCYPGVSCVDTADGPRCGNCPYGYTGDGYQCRQSCDSKRCARGVECYETVGGPQCGPCPSGFTGNGEVCEPNTCHCFAGVECIDTPRGQKCGDCPYRYYGDGEHCTPGPKCKDSPCHPGVDCRDGSDGRAICGECPSGTRGDGFR